MLPRAQAVQLLVLLTSEYRGNLATMQEVT
jgi:hypothetical protein